MKVKLIPEFPRLIFALCLTGLLVSNCSESDDPDPGNMGTDPDKSANQQPVGASANDFLSGEDFQKLTVEIQYVEGFQPTETALNNLKAFLQTYLNKSEGITFNTTALASPGLAPYSVQDLQAIEDENRTAYNRDNVMAAYIFFADGAYHQDTDDSKVLGIAYRNTSMAIFQSTVQEFSGGLLQPNRSLLESTILNHEFGHVMGLVNIGTPLQSDHQDTEHGNHCDVEDCLMNWVVQTGNIAENLVNTETVPPLDDQCIADLKANGGK